jgi:hypothetical protein
MLTAKDNIEIEFELLKKEKYHSIIKWTDNKTFKLPKLIEDSYIQNKITKEEKNMYEMKLYELIFKTNNELIFIYSKKKEDEIEEQRIKYLKKQLYIDSTIDKSIYNLNYIYSFKILLIIKIMFIYLIFSIFIYQ